MSGDASNTNTPPVRRFGHVAIVGRPNVGKSTLLNAFVGQKIAAESRRRHTTRNRILGIRTEGETQMALVDTPGLETDPKGGLGRHLARTAAGVIHDVDVLVMMVEAGRWLPDDEAVLVRVCRAGVPVVLAVNKIDRLEDRETLLPYIDQLQSRHDFAGIVPISSLRKTNLDALAGVIAGLLPEGEFHFAEDQVTDRNERFLATEIIREQLMEQLGEEVPYAAYVEIEAFQEGKNDITISAAVTVERDSQKAIVIGRGGYRIKAISMAARKSLEEALGMRVHLRLWVKVREDWRKDAGALRKAGLDFES